MGVLNVPTAQLVAGMIVAEDVFTNSGEKILLKNTIINPKLIIKLKMYGIKEIIAFIPQSIADKLPVPDAHVNQLKTSEDFKVFKQSYMDSVGELKTVYGSILNQKTLKVEPDMIYAAASSILKEATNSIRTFEMLHCMRDYDDSTYVHCMNVALIARAFGAWLNLPESDQQLLTICGLLHDVGKLLIPPEIITKPDKLTPEEFKIIKTHTTLGYQLIKDMDVDSRVKDAVWMHHERSDGSGYPKGLKGSEITSFAKIIAISDVYDAMTASRVYRGAICPFEVVEEFERDGYAKYDVAYLLCFLEHIVQSYINTPVRLSNSMIGEVVLINRQHLSRPTVKVDNQFFDLSKDSSLKITAIL